MKARTKGRKVKRLLKGLAISLLVLVTLAAVLSFALRGQIIDKVMSVAQSRLSEKGLYIDHTSYQLNWAQGIVINDFTLFRDESKLERIALFENLAIRIPFSEVFGSEPRLILSSEQGDLQIDSSAGPLLMEDVDFKLIFANQSLEIEHLSGHLNGLNLITKGTLQLAEREAGKQVEIPDLAAVVQASKWLDFTKGTPTLKLQIDLASGGKPEVHARFEGDDFRWKSLEVDRAQIQAGLERGAVHVSDFDLTCCDGSIHSAFVYDFGKQQVQISRINSTADPFQLIRAIAGETLLPSFQSLGDTSIRGEDLLIDLTELARSKGSVSISSAEGIMISSGGHEVPIKNYDAIIRYDSGDLSIDAQHLDIRNINLGETRLQARFNEGSIDVPEFHVDGFDGNLSGALVFDISESKLLISTLKSSANPFRLVDGIMGEQKLARFQDLGTTTLEGSNLMVDLRAPAKSSGTLDISSPAGLLIPLGKSNISLEQFSGDLSIDSGKLSVRGRHFSLHGGKSHGSFSMPLSTGFRYQTKITTKDASATQAGKTFGLGNELSGTISASFEGGGAVGFKSHYGKGSLRIRDGKFYSVPILGSLRAFLSKKSSKFGMDEAGDLSTTFTLKNGIIRSSDFRIESTSVVLLSEGQIDFSGKTVDLDVRANLKGVAGLATGIASHILALHGTGPFTNIRWTMKSLEGVQKGLESTAEGVGGLLKGAGEATGKLFEWRPRKKKADDE